MGVNNIGPMDTAAMDAFTGAIATGDNSGIIDLFKTPPKLTGDKTEKETPTSFSPGFGIDKTPKLKKTPLPAQQKTIEAPKISPSPLPAIDPSQPYPVVKDDTYWNIAGRLMSLFPNRSQRSVSDELQNHFSSETLKAGMSTLNLSGFLTQQNIPYGDKREIPINPDAKYTLTLGDDFYSIAHRLKQSEQFANTSPQELVKSLQNYFGDDLIQGVSIDIPGFSRQMKKSELAEKEPETLNVPKTEVITTQPGTITEPAPIKPLSKPPAPKIPVWKQLSGTAPPPPGIEIPSVEYARTHTLSKAKISSLMDELSSDPLINIPKSIWMAQVFKESSNRPYINSKSNAIGIIQLLPRAAREGGLKVNTLIDERFDPKKNLQAGGRYLTRMYKLSYNPALTKEQNWNEALFTYIGGRRNVLRYNAGRQDSNIGPESKAYGPNILELAKTKEYAQYDQ